MCIKALFCETIDLTRNMKNFEFSYKVDPCLMFSFFFFSFVVYKTATKFSFAITWL